MIHLNGVIYPPDVKTEDLPSLIVNGLSDRELDLLKIQIVRYEIDVRSGVNPKGQVVFIEVSQQIDRAPVGIEVVPCLCPKGKIVCLAYKTILSGDGEGLICRIYDDN